jgi:hypothetical protein
METTGNKIIKSYKFSNPDRPMEGSKKAKITQGLALNSDTWENLSVISSFYNRSRNNLIESTLLDLIQKFKKENPGLELL